MNRIKSLISIIIYYLMQIFGVLIIISLSLLMNNDKISKDNLLSNFNLITFGVTMLITLGIVFIINYKVLIKKFKQLSNLKTYLHGIIGFGILVCANFCVGLIRIISSSFLKIPIEEAANQQAVVNLVKGNSPIIIVLFIGFIIPILEEIIFRYCFMSVVNNDTKVRRIWPYLICSLLFAFIHQPDIFTKISFNVFFNFLQYLALSSSITFTYYFSNHNLGSTCIVHIIQNTFSVIFILILQYIGVM